MKRFLLLLSLLALPAFAVQVFRVDPSPVMTTAGNAPSGGFPALYAVAGASINICTDAACSIAATTYADSTGNTACPTTAPVTLSGTTLCTATTGAQGQFGFWLTPGTYWYKITFPSGQVFGSFPITSNTAGVTSLVGGTGISVNNGGVGVVTVTNTGVVSFNGRTGAVVPATNDYTYAQIGGAVQGNTTKPQMAGTNSGAAAALLCNDASGNATTSGCSAGVVTSFNSRTGAVIPTTGDYVAGMITNLPLRAANDYNFSPLSPGGSLAIGNNAVTLTPCPSGISATSVNLGMLYISGGTGAAEGVPIIGYSTGSGNCQVIVTVANNHTGAWTIAPAAGGVIEAITAASAAGGGLVDLNVGTISVYARIIIPSNVQIQGQGTSTILQLAANSWPATYTGPFACSANYACLIMSLSSSNVAVRNLKLDMNGANQVNIINGADIYLVDCGDCLVEDVTAINSKHIGGFGFSIMLGGVPGPSKNNVYNHNTIHGYGSANSGGLPTCGGGIFVQGSGGRITNNYSDNLCDAAYIANAGTGIVISHNYWKASGAAVLLGSIYSSEDSNYTVMTDNVCEGESNIGCYVIGWVPGVAGSIGGLIANNECYGGMTMACARIVSDTGFTVKHVTISGNRFSRGILVGLFSGTGATGISNINITGNTINDCPGVGILISYGANHVNIGNNTITGCLANYGIDVTTANTADIFIHDNLLNGNAGDILDSSNLATICRNHTDSSWDGQCNLINANYRTSTLVNGANQNVSTVPTLPAAAVAANTVADIQLEVTGPTGAFNIGGFATPSAGRMITLNNTTAQTMTINNQDASSTAANRIITPTGANVVAKVAILVYSPGQLRWIVQSYQ